jgi:hypothetical protein
MVPSLATLLLSLAPLAIMAGIALTLSYFKNDTSYEEIWYDLCRRASSRERASSGYEFRTLSLPSLGSFKIILRIGAWSAFITVGVVVPVLGNCLSVKVWIPVGKPETQQGKLHLETSGAI